MWSILSIQRWFPQFRAMCWTIKVSRVVILGIRRPFGRCTKQDTVNREIIVPNLLYYNNFSYCCPPTWQLAVWGGCPQKCVRHQPEQLQAQAGMGTGADSLGRHQYLRSSVHPVRTRLPVVAHSVRARHLVHTIASVLNNTSAPAWAAMWQFRWQPTWTR